MFHPVDLICRLNQKLYPELARLPDTETRVNVLNETQAALRSAVGPARYYVELFAVIWGGPLAGLALSQAVAQWGDLPRALGPICWVLLPLAGFVVCAAILSFAWRERVRRELRRMLVARGVPMCVHCGYDLRGQTDPRCPECARAFDPALLQKAPDNRAMPDATPDDRHAR